MKKLIVLCGIMFVSVVAVAKIGEQPLLRINERVITVEEFKRMSQFDVFEAELSAKAKTELLDNVIFFELAIQEAKKRGFAQLPAVQDEINISLFQAYFNFALKPQIQNIRVDAKRVSEEYKAHPIVDTSQIFIAVPVTATHEQRLTAKKRIDDIYARISKAPANKRLELFGQLAKEFSEDASRELSGRLGFLGADQAHPYYYAVVHNKRAGALTEPFAGPYGWHIAYVHSVVPEAQMGSYYRNFLETKVRTDEGLKLMKATAARLKQGAKISVNTQLLESM